MSSTPSKSPNRVQHFKGHVQDLSEKVIEFPIKVKDIPNIERQSPTLSIDLFCYEEKELLSIYISEQRREKHVNLLMNGNNETMQYCLIRILSRPFASLTKYKVNKVFFDCCLLGFTRQDQK